MSLRGRFTLAATLILGAALVGLGVHQAQREAERNELELERRLEHALRSTLARVVAEHPSALTSRGPDETLRLELGPQSDGARVAVELALRHATAQRERVHAGASLPRPDALRTLEQGRVLLNDWIAPDGARYGALGLRLGFTDDATHAVEGVALIERAPLDAARSERLLAWSLAGILALLGGATLAYLAAGWALRPVRRAAEAAERISALEHRLPSPSVDDELGRLVRVLNGMLSRVQSASSRERNFVAAASHELRRPLAALLVELELALKSERSAAELRAALEQALGDAQAMGRLVDSLLLRARAQAGQLKPREGEVDAVQLVAEGIDRSLRLLGERAAVRMGDVEPLTLMADDSLLGMVVENLLVNAGTHGGEGVAVEVRCRQEPGGAAVLEVEDDGPGIPAAEQRRIFEPFGRGDRVRSVSGTGLGLAIVRDAVHAHGGEIELQSPVRAGRGTRFVVRLPAKRVA